MEIVYLNSRGLFVKNGEDNGIPQYSEIDMLDALSYEVSIGKSFTVEDLMEFLMQNQEIVEKTFASFTRSFKLTPYYETMLRAPAEVENKLTHIEFNWNIDYMDSYFAIFTSFSAISDEKDGKMSYGVTMSPMCEWAHLPIVINEEFKIVKYTTPRLYEQDEKGVEQAVVVDAIKPFTLYDLIGTFLRELTFFGYPEHVDLLVKKLEIGEEQIRNGNYITLEEMQLGFKEDDLKKAIAEEDYEEAAELRKEIEYLRKKISQQNREK